ncbi:MAG: glycosyltransferase [Ilumatobacteraceae bacterium]
MLGNFPHEDVAAPAHEHSAHRRSQYQWSLASTTISPRFSIITPVYDPPLGAFLACIDSVVSQTFSDWEWCVVDDCSTRPEVRAALEALSQRDPRIRVIHRSTNGGIVAASNDALSMACGEFVAMLDHDDGLVPNALEQMAATIDSAGEVDYVYSDEAHVLADGRESAHFLKPGWSPERFRSSMYTCHLSALRRDVVTEVGGFRTGFDGSQDHDLILRATEVIAARGRRVVHLPALLYHWRNISSSVSRATSSLNNAVARGRQAVQEQCDRLGVDATVVHGPVEGTYRLVRTVAADTPITVVVATRAEEGASRPYRLAVAATTEALRTTHPSTRLVVTYPESLPTELVALLDDAAGDRWELLPVKGDWSIAAALDRAFNDYPCEVLVSVAPGLVPRSDLTPDWLETMAGLARSPGTGVVGSLIADDNDMVVHAGWDVPNFRWYELEGLRVETRSTGNDLLIERECTHVSLAAAAVSAGHWREGRDRTHGGFDAAGRALSAALSASGARTVWTPYARFDQVVRIDR